MNLNDLLPAGGVDALAAQLGIPREQAQRGAEALLPSLVAGMGNRAGGTGAGTAELEQHFNTLGGAGLADNVVGPEPTEVAKGNQLLGGILGSKDASRQVASEASEHTGLDPSLLKQMLPILAMLVAGHLAKQGGGQSGGIGGILTSVLGSLAASGGTSGGTSQGGLGGGLGGILNSVLGGGRH
jgi:hypothetical protein